MVYDIGMRSRPRQRQVGIGPGALQAALLADLPDRGLALVAEFNGGGYTEIRFGQDVGDAFARVADQLHSQYLFSFAPSKCDGKAHDIEVRVDPRGLNRAFARTKSRRRSDWARYSGSLICLDVII
jgi:hypothetical protein